MNFNRYLREFKKSNKRVEDVICVDNVVYKVVERLIESESLQRLPLIVKPYKDSKGFLIFEQVLKKMSSKIFDTVQRLEDNVFYVQFSGEEKDFKGVYIIDEYSEVFLSPSDYELLVKSSGAFKKMCDNSSYKTHISAKGPKQFGE